MVVQDKGNLVVEELDQEWVKLIREAKELGISVQDIKEFLQENKKS
ncbi:SinR repressor domain-containing protein dimerization [Priestia megaterium]|nr:SinR repressor domain-containing protein dimerization [Priestia megaterium]